MKHGKDSKADHTSQVSCLLRHLAWFLCSRHSFHEPEYLCSRLILIIKKMWVITRKPSPGIIYRVGDTA